MMFATAILIIMTIILVVVMITSPQFMSLSRRARHQNSDDDSAMTSSSVHVAFVGNSFQFVNDLPRFMESLANNAHAHANHNRHNTKQTNEDVVSSSSSSSSPKSQPPYMVQDSMLHGSLSLSSLLRKGNGMITRWNTTEAKLSVVVDENYYGVNNNCDYDDDEADEDDNGDNENDDDDNDNDDGNDCNGNGNDENNANNNANAQLVYMNLNDYGCCTITQLLLGYDSNLVSHNKNEYYKDDGKNPCFQSDTYLEFSQNKYYYQNMMLKLEKQEDQELEYGSSYNIINNDDDDYNDDDDDDSVSNDDYYNDDDDDDGYSSSNQIMITPNMTRHWDYVVMNDQSMRPAILSKRSHSIKSLQKSYAPLFVQSNSVPVFFMTYGYWRPNINMTFALNGGSSGNSGNVNVDGVPVYDVPTFTSRLYRGYQLYVEALDEALVKQQQKQQNQQQQEQQEEGGGSATISSTKTTTTEPIRTRLAPVGLVFLVIWEENYSMWQRLFFTDGFHPSPLGKIRILQCHVKEQGINRKVL